MTGLPAYAAALPGFFVGIFVVLAFNHWLVLLLTAIGKGPDPKSPSRGWATIFAFVHPVPWLLGFGAARGVQAISRNALHPAWAWLWGAAIVTTVSLYGISIVAAMTMKTSKLPDPTRPESHT
jgi:hypothetical protein